MTFIVDAMEGAGEVWLAMAESIIVCCADDDGDGGDLDDRCSSGSGIAVSKSN